MIPQVGSWLSGPLRALEPNTKFQTAIVLALLFSPAQASVAITGHQIHQLDYSVPAAMADTSTSEEPVFAVIPDVPSPEDSQQEQQPEGRRTSIATSHHARPRPYHIPRLLSHTYPEFKAKQECALKIGVHDLEKEMCKSTGVSYLEMFTDKLTVNRKNSQSKLSQQELVDLQKATHFDKKELQQWYKGEQQQPHHPTRRQIALTRNNRLPQGLSFWHAYQVRIPKDL